MSHFNQIYRKFGETKGKNFNYLDAVLTYKKVNVKELSEKYEQQAKEHSKKEQMKTELRKIAIKEKENEKNTDSSSIKLKRIRSSLFVENQLFKYRLLNAYNDELMKKVNEFQNPILFNKETDGYEANKFIETKLHMRRQMLEQNEIQEILKKFKDNYFRDYHYIYKTPYKHNRIQISCFKENEELKINFNDTDALEKDYSDTYKDLKLLSIKNLQRYDCWPDLDPQEWVKLCAETEDNDEPHGTSPNYQNGQYHMLDVKVEKYDEEQMKFLINFYKSLSNEKSENKNRKFVSRLSLLFKKENPNEWKFRKFLCEERRDKNDDIILFTRYIDNVPFNLISTISENSIKKIYKYLLFDTENLAKAYNHLFSSDNPEMQKQIKIIFQDYMRQMKKCRILMELQEIKNLDSFFKRNIKYREYFPKILTPKLGIVDENKSGVKVSTKIKKFNKEIFFDKTNYTELMIEFVKICEKFKKDKLLIHHIEEFRLPLTDKEFEIIYTKNNEKSRESLQNICKHALKHIINDKINQKNIFHFFDEEEYKSSKIRKILLFFNCILKSKIEELTKSSIEAYLSFIRKFIPCDYSKYHITESEIPLFKIDLEFDKKNLISYTPRIDLVEEEKEKDGEKSKKKVENYRDSLITAFTHVQKTVNEITDLMSSCIRPLTLKSKTVFNIDDNYPIFKQGLEEIHEICNYGHEKIMEVRQEYVQFEYIMKYKAEEFVKRKIKLNKISSMEDVVICGDLLKEICNLKLKLDALPTEYKLKLFLVNTKEIHLQIHKKIVEIKSELGDNYMLLYSDNCIKNLNSDALVRISNLNKIPKNIDEHEELYKLIQETPAFVDQKKQELNNIENIFNILELNFTNFDRKKFNAFIKNWKLPNNVDDAKKEGSSNLNKKGVDFQEELNKRKNELSDKVLKLGDNFDRVKSINNIEKIELFYDDKKIITSFKMNLEALKTEMIDITRHMIILEPEKKEQIEKGEVELPGFDKIVTCLKEFENYDKVWKYADDIVGYYAKIISDISNINPISSKDKGISENFEFVTLLDKTKFEVDIINKNNQDVTITKLCGQIKENIKKFEGYCWIVQNLRSSTLKPEDYDQICKFLEIKDQTELMKQNLKFLKEEKGIDNFRSEIESIKSKAVRRAVFLNDLKNLQTEFSLLEFTTKVTKDKTKISDIDVLQQKLDEQTNKLQMILGNPVTLSDIKLRTDARNYNEKIKNVQNVLEEIIKFQSSYWYLLPIFEGEEVNRELMAEKKRFDQIDNFWKKNIVETIEDPNINAFIEKDQNLHKQLLENNKLTADIIFKLLEYLNVKRDLFPRFYFVSDEDLMKILAQTKDPTLIQQHLSKCFEGINRVTFDDKNEIISQMISSEDEVVDLVDPINVNEEICKGKVEVWLKFLSDDMVKTMKVISNNCRNDYFEKLKNGKKRLDWLLTNWPGQIVQTIDQEIWTKEVEKSIVASEEEINEYYNELQNNLKDVVDIIRTDISKSLSITLSALIIISVHNKEVVENLIKKKITEVSEFEWIANMRYEWDNTWNTGKNIDKCPLKVKMVTSELNYGFEYLGNVSRLVITPMTDRCFRTLFGAYQVKFGGAPEGPAGTGKTESVKDLSKCVGTKCNVFNCTEGINIISMNKFFLGLCSSGCWCCFDEFNRIDTEVLSVIAQQILTIQEALKLGTGEFKFDGKENVKILDTCAINITMNPSYSGRNDLPDNLKALFRPCAMMVANYYLIAQIKLYSFGFQDANTLSNKVVTSLNLSSQQLSTQSHYDFGMRSLNAILVAAGKLKKLEPNENEDKIVLRALIEVNLPKFTINDTPLFLGIITDLFPTTKRIIVDYKFLNEGLTNACNELNLQPNPNFLNKCIQLYETSQVRHALMVVGQAGLGKSNIIKCLYKAMNNYLDGKLGYLEQHILNPKSILNKQLYGHFNPISKEWCKGLIQVKMVDLVDKPKEMNKWLIFDGPVDTLWIESMNSLLDDNKKLCLDDSSSIPLGHNMNIMFEVDDLREASPATVSRNGMVLCEKKTIKFFDIVMSYISDLPNIFEQKFKLHFINQFNYLIKPVLAYLDKNKDSYGIFIDHNNLVQNILKMFECFLYDYRQRDLQKESITLKETEKLTNEKIENMLLFAFITSAFGIMKKNQNFMKESNQFIIDLCSAEKDLLTKYNLDISEYSYVKEGEELVTSSGNKNIGSFYSDIITILCSEWSHKKIGSKISDLKYVYDFAYYLYENKWRHWNETIEEFKIDAEMSYSELIIPTSETIKISHLLQLAITNKKNLLFTGNTGTGKTLTIYNTLMSKFENESYTYIKMAFTAQTTTELTQSIIEGKLTKSYRRFSPSKSRKGVLFIDDLNMPERETFGAQPPIELLRQWLDYEGWYDLVSDNKEFVKIVDLSLVAAMGNVASGRTVSQRFIRHSIVQFCDSYPQTTIFKIFSNVMDWFFKRTKLDNKIMSFKDSTIDATSKLYNQCTLTFKATPAKTHYLFNLRDVSRVFQGISKSNNLGIRDEVEYIKLWIHECERVFKDRLINNDDRNNFDKILAESMKTHFRRELHSFTNKGSILFTNFVPYIYPDNDNTKQPYQNLYCEIPDLEIIKRKLNEKLDEYNIDIKQKVDSNGSVLSLVFFPYAIEHVCRIARILSTEGGNALLVGLGGSGRRSLTLLTCSIYSYQSFEIENAAELKDQDYRDKIKENLLKEKALQGKETTWIISDTQIGSDANIEDINSFLNNGEIPNLITSDDFNNIKEYIQSQDRLMVKKPTAEGDFFNIFVELCKRNVHIVLCMSPIGEAFRKRVMKFPSLINCTSINWFLRWPDEALKAVAEFFLHDTISDEYLTKISDVCVDMQKRAIIYSEKFKNELKRYYYVTPMSYIQLLKLFQNLLGKTENTINNEINRYKNGLLILEQAEITSNVMREKIETVISKALAKEKQISEEKVKILEELAIKLKIDEEEGERKKEQAIIAKASSEEKNLIASTSLKEIEEMKENAKEKLSNLKQDEVMQLKKSKEDKYIAEFCRYLCLLMVEPAHPKPKVINPKEPPVKDYFEHAVKNVLSSQTFLKQLRDFKSTKMSAERATELNEEIQKSKSTFEPEKKSMTLKNLFDIVCIHNDIYWINQKYLPAKELAETSSREAKEAEDSLQLIMENLAQLKAFQKEKDDEKRATDAKIKQLEKDLNQSKERLNNAVKLVDNLSNEKKNWTHKKDSLEISKKTLLGDILLSCGIIAYLGAFNKSYREEIIYEWNKLILKNNIPITAENHNLVLQKTLSSSYEIDQWKSKNLPNDSFSVDNAIIISKSTRYCLLIDPQNQANEWINNTYKNQDGETKKKKQGHGEAFNTLRPTSDKDQVFKKTREVLEHGGVLLFENATEQLNSLLMPVFKKEFIEDGGDTYCNFNGQKIYMTGEVKVFITTKNPRPHYLPEVCVNFTLVNFTVTEDGLEDQMLNFLVEKDAYEIELKRRDGNKRMNELNTEKKHYENIILNKLGTYSNNEDKVAILDDTELINTLESSKQKADEADLTISRQKEQDIVIEKTRTQYRPVATHVSQLFFTLSDLSNIEPVYQYSLNWYKNIFDMTIKIVQAKNIQDKNKKNESLKDNFTSLLYDKVCLSLFEKDKLVFSFMLFTKISMISMNSDQKEVYNKEIRFLVTGGAGKEFTYTNPAKDDNDIWLSTIAWYAICELDILTMNFMGLKDSFIKDINKWKSIFTSSKPFDENFPEPFNSLSKFHKLCIGRIISPDKCIPIVKELIDNGIGDKYTKPPEFDILKSYSESKNNTPIFFILSPGADPMVLIKKLADSVNRDWEVDCKKLSLGQGQRKVALEKINDGKKEQKWIILQNCHLAKSFMDDLEKEIENFIEDENSMFRLFLTASPSDVIPISIIQNSIKLTNEPPRGIKQSLTRCFTSFDERFFDQSKKPVVCKKFIYSICFFHSLVLERRKYGALGWNIPYEFSFGDLSISLNQMKLFLNNYTDIQWEAMWYMIAEANYGGRVTDPSDRVLINVVLRNIVNNNVLGNDFSFDSKKEYQLPTDLKYANVLNYISKNVPDEDKPEIFGMHSNADITYAINTTNSFFQILLQTLPKQSSSKDGKSSEEEVKERAEQVIKKLPKKLDLDKAMKNHKVEYEQCLNSVLHQEIMRYNNLLSKILSYLKNLIDAVNGDVIMTSDLESFLLKMYDNKTPRQIEKISYPSLKPFSLWVNDFVEKLNFLQKWIDNGMPSSFWIDGFFLINSFLTGVLQNYARKVRKKYLILSNMYL